MAGKEEGKGETMLICYASSRLGNSKDRKGQRLYV